MFNFVFDTLKRINICNLKIWEDMKILTQLSFKIKWKRINNGFASIDTHWCALKRDN